MKYFKPPYHKLLESRGFSDRIREAQEHNNNCQLFGWQGGLNQTTGYFGSWCAGQSAFVSNYGAHLIEERLLSSRMGSETFYSGCNHSANIP